MGRRKKKGISLNEYANIASAQGLTYGQMQAQEYISKSERKPIPEGYRKISEKS